MQASELRHISPGRVAADAGKTEQPVLHAKVFHKWLLPVLYEWTAIVCLFIVGYLIDHVVAWAAVTILLGSRQHGLGVLGHDGAHFTAAKNRKLNDIASEVFCFWPLITGLGDFRNFHFNHHRHFGTDKDPELLFKNNWSKEQWELPMTRSRIISYFLLDLAGFGLLEVLKAYRLLGKTSLRSSLGPLAWWSVVGFLLYSFGLGLAIVIWFVALGTSFWGFHRLRTWTEHVGTSSTHRVRANWWQRILITPHCSWTHYEHHAYPSIPFWRRHELRHEEESINMGELFSSFSSASDREAAR
jgi:fatty acid desaturase